jgi:hypothetical protein
LQNILKEIKWNTKYASIIFIKLNIETDGAINVQKFILAVSSSKPIDLGDGKTFKDFYYQILIWTPIQTFQQV